MTVLCFRVTDIKTISTVNRTNSGQDLYKPYITLHIAFVLETRARGDFSLKVRCSRSKTTNGPTVWNYDPCGGKKKSTKINIVITQYDEKKKKICFEAT